MNFRVGKHGTKTMKKVRRMQADDSCEKVLAFLPERERVVGASGFGRKGERQIIFVKINASIMKPIFIDDEQT